MPVRPAVYLSITADINNSANDRSGYDVVITLLRICVSKVNIEMRCEDGRFLYV